MAPPCLTCNRELARKGEAEEVIRGLELPTRAIPVKMRSLEGKVARQSSWLLHLGQFLLQLNFFSFSLTSWPPLPWSL